MKKTPRINPSSAAFCIGESVHTQYGSGCLRNLLLKFWIPRRVEIKEIYQRVGAAHEAFYARKIKAEVFGAEVPIGGDIQGIPIKGRMDFVLPLKDGDKVIVETKGTNSKYALNSVIKQGKLKLNQLAQLVFYMITQKCNKGKLVYGVYEEVEDSYFRQIGYREFKITFNPQGQILIDGVPYEHTVSDQVDHQMRSAEVLKNETIWDRPANADAKWGSPCGYCDYIDVCAKWDSGEYTCKEDVIEGEKDD